MKHLFLTLILVITSCARTPVKSQKDPLPSWANTEVKESILSYIARVTNPKSEGFIPEADRVAVFDHDGTLMPEVPVMQVYYVETKARAVGKTIKPKMSEQEKKLLFVAANTGMTNESYRQNVTEFYQKAKHPKFNMPFKQAAYLPQKELIQYLKENGFKVFISTHDTADFVRPFSEELYGVPEENVIGSSFKYQYDKSRNSLVRLPEPAFVNTKEGKAYSLEMMTGKHPVFTVGNIGTGEDVYMLRYSQGSKYPNYQLLIRHDDPDREFAYGNKDNLSEEWAKKYNWKILSMKKDWKTIFTQ